MQNRATTTNGNGIQSTLATHPNGRPIKLGMKRPTRNHELLFEDVFPDTEMGKTLRGLVVTSLTKQEHRIGWARKSACDDQDLMSHPNETVASHQWGVAQLIMVLTRDPKFQAELPDFDRCKAIEMALTHDVAELETGDITPVDGISAEEKHKMESDAMKKILGCFPDHTKESLHELYNAYETRQCIESKFVKDCDKLDFMIYAFVLERQGFTGFPEFYENSKRDGFFTKTAAELADTLIQARNSLKEQNLIYRS